MHVIFMGRRLAAALALMIFAGALAAAPDDYLRGYFDALLDNRFPGLGLEVETLGPGGHVVISAQGCLGPSQRRDVERLLLQTRRAHTVTWGADAGCDPQDRAPETAAEEAVQVHPLPEFDLFAPLLADPRQPRFSVSYQRYRTSGEDFSAASVAFGEYFGLAAGVFSDSWAWQTGIQGAVFALFNLDAPSNDLINADYWIGVPLSYRKGPRSYVVRLYHQSSHLGDEFLLNSSGIERVNLSYEDFEALAAYEYESFRFYAGGGYILQSEPELDPWHAQIGVEYTRSNVFGRLDLVAAMDVQAAEELDWARSRVYQAGLEFRSGPARRTRLMLEYFSGRSPDGQFYREALHYAGVGLYFGF